MLSLSGSEIAELKSPVAVWIEPADECLSDCSRCEWRDRNVVEKISEANLTGILQRCEEAEVSKIVFGGPSLLNVEELYPILQTASKVGFVVSVATCGTSIPTKADNVNKIISLLEKTDIDKLELFVTSPPSADLVKFAKSCLVNFVPCIFNLVVTDANCTEINETAKRVSDLSVSGVPVPLSLVRSLGASSKIIKEMALLTPKIETDLHIKINIEPLIPSCVMKALGGTTERMGFCGAGRTWCVINKDGQVFPCTQLRISMGNVFQEALLDLWRKNENLQSARPNEDKCRSCPQIELCRGGCKAAIYGKYKRFDGADPIIYETTLR